LRLGLSILDPEDDGYDADAEFQSEVIDRDIEQEFRTEFADIKDEEWPLVENFVKISAEKNGKSLHETMDIMMSDMNVITVFEKWKKAPK
jgi:hypothetical protein